MILLKQFTAKMATKDEWRDYHMVVNTYVLETEPTDEPLGFKEYVISKKAWLDPDDGINIVFLAYFKGDIAGFVSANKHEDLPAFFVNMIVLPKYRQNGVGTELFKRIKGEITDLGFKNITFFCKNLKEDGDKFLKKNGVKKGLTQKGNQLILKNINEALLERWVENGKKSGYESGVWVNAIPQEYMEGFTAAYNSINDAPHGDLEDMQMNMTPEALLSIIRMVTNGGNEILFSWVRNIENGDFVATSDLFILNSQPSIASQANTSTVPKYRGNGFAKTVKALTALYLIKNRPQARFIRTSNATVNEGMLAINKKMGFEQHQVHTIWELML